MPTLVERTVLVNQKVSDLWGLLMDLRRADFKVRNVSSDVRGTYVHLELDEDKDPAPIVEAWVGKVAPKPSALLKEIRIKELSKVKEEEAARVVEREERERKLDEARARGEILPEAEEKPADGAPASQEGPGLLKRFFRKFF